MALILLVEDDTDTREMLVRFLSRTGYEPLACGSAEEARELCGAAAPALALLDINLPGDHGVKLAWELRQRFPALPIVVMSALLDRWEEDDLLDCGATALVAKPFDLPLLDGTLRRLLPETA